MLSYKTQLGECYCGDSHSLIVEQLEDNSVDLVVTSPPFALLRQKEYGNENQYKYVDWLCEFAGGAIPPNLLQIPNSESNSLYLRCCKEVKIKGHPARYPSALPEFFINFLTDSNDLVVDIFAGSNTTGAACEKLGRRWKSFELQEEYVWASSFRFLNDVSEATYVFEKLKNSEFIDFSV